MAEIISSVLQKQMGGNSLGMEKQAQQSQNQRSFENVLQQNGNQQNAGTQSTTQTNGISNPKLETMRLDLIDRYQNLPNGTPKVSAIFPEFIDTKTRMSSFRSMLSKAVGATGETPQATNVQGRFAQVESEWYKLENIMRSDKEMSQGELLGLQARLYQVSQHVDVLSKVVDQMTSGVKTILNTNV